MPEHPTRSTPRTARQPTAIAAARRPADAVGQILQLAVSAALATALIAALIVSASGCAAPPPDSAEPSTPDAATPAEEAGGEGYAREAAVFEDLAPELAGLFADGAELEVLAEGFTWSEGPVWIPGADFLLFSDVPQDTVFRWSEAKGLEPWLRPSGFTGDGERSREPGANGLYLNADGQLLLCQHGDRRVARLDADVAAGPFLGPFEDGGPFVTITADFDGRRYNSPNDLAVHADGSIYFTDPPYGLRDESERELAHHGVYRIVPGASAQLLYAELTRPNGVVLSPDGSTLTVANSDPEKALWMSWPVLEDGGLGEGRVTFDATPFVSEERPGLPDGMTVDSEGRIYATGPGGIWIFAADGRHLGTLRLPDATANVTFGGPDRSTLYLTSHHRLLRLETTATGHISAAGPDA